MVHSRVKSINEHMKVNTRMDNIVFKITFRLRVSRHSSVPQKNSFLTRECMVIRIATVPKYFVLGNSIKKKKLKIKKWSVVTLPLFCLVVGMSSFSFESIFLLQSTI